MEHMLSIRAGRGEAIRVSDLIEHDISLLSGLTKQVDFALVLALTRTAQRVKEALIAEMKSAFDRPTPHTLKSLHVQPATKRSMEAGVWITDEAVKGVPAVNYLYPQTHGGSRKDKSTEVALRRYGHLPNGMQAVPGEGARLNKYGNITGGRYSKILSSLRIQWKDSQQNRNSDKAGSMFVGRPGGAPLGVWERAGRSVRPMLIFAEAPTYTPRFDFNGVARRIVNKVFATEFELALMHAFKTARSR